MNHDLYIGKFNPLHIGHLKVIQKMQNPIVCIVYKETEDPLTAPLTLVERRSIINKTLTNMDLGGFKVIDTKNGFIVDLIKELYAKGIKINNVYAGPDRFYSYAKNFEKYPMPYIPNLIMAERYTSSTYVRECAKMDNRLAFESLTPEPVHQEFESIKQKTRSFLNKRALIKKEFYVETENFKFKDEDYSDLNTSYNRVMAKCREHCKGYKDGKRVFKIYEFFKEQIKCCNIEFEYDTMLLKHTTDYQLAVNMIKRFSWIVACYQTCNFDRIGENDV